MQFGNVHLKNKMLKYFGGWVGAELSWDEWELDKNVQFENMQAAMCWIMVNVQAAMWWVGVYQIRTISSLISEMELNWAELSWEMIEWELDNK